MSGNPDDLEQNIETLKTSVRKSFARIYASLKARELKTLRQLDAIRKQCQDNKELEINCVQNINICYSDQSTLLDIVSNYGVIDFERLSFDSSTFILEDYISPNDDHMYSYKTIEEITENEDVGAIEEAALKQITDTDDCDQYLFGTNFVNGNLPQKVGEETLM
ncbi:jg14801 [Pararge aegeria aegeria]|uniref:Jg14801 protein n=1 Tax=Pararge aegeria aegeria TaxID=348720 RepID=A0A8S4R952_9NEOP|nr:jg14801 [Pararge aegeria aegeria]